MNGEKEREQTGGPVRRRYRLEEGEEEEDIAGLSSSQGPVLSHLTFLSRRADRKIRLLTEIETRAREGHRPEAEKKKRSKRKQTYKSFVQNIDAFSDTSSMYDSLEERNVFFF